MATLTKFDGEAIFSHGGPTTEKHTPEAAVDAGDVVLIGDMPCIAHLAIAAGELGAVAVGGGHYDGKKDGSSGPVFEAGDPVYWDDSARLFVETETDYYAGDCTIAAGTDEDRVRFHHKPNSLLSPAT